MIGATTTLLAFTIVILLGAAFSGLDLSKLFSHPRDYAHDEPWRVAICSVVAMVLSFGIAALAPRVMFKRPKNPDVGSYNSDTVWLDSFEKERPGNKAVGIAAELQDGLRIVGILRAFTPTEGDDREIRLGQIKVTKPGKQTVEFPKDNFLILRESQLRYMIGEYVSKAGDASNSAS
jgi:hypothetical protein